MSGFWIGWIAVVLTSFGVAEFIGARKNGEKGTLSYRIWSFMFEDVDGKRKKRRGFVWFAITAVFGWLTLHFATGGLI